MSTAPEACFKLDEDRQGNIEELVLEAYVEKYPIAGDIPGRSPMEGDTLDRKVITRLNAFSCMSEKQEGAPIDYNANYLVLRVRPTGSTYFGAGIDIVQATIVDVRRTGSQMPEFRFRSVDPCLFDTDEWLPEKGKVMPAT